ncbi:MAG: tetratricopeptide repeat protein, partial [Candidatus Omnitrophica bacterium]|nr:tetratricopeptide repeat protein [Candidatus Omnitrophota bacterium]
TYDEMEQSKKAFEYYSRAIEIDPYCIKGYCALALIYGEEKNHKKAMELIQKALELDPNNDVIHWTIGNLYRYKVQYDKAIEAFKKAIEANPWEPKNYDSLANAYECSTKFKEAIKVWGNLSTLDPYFESDIFPEHLNRLKLISKWKLSPLYYLMLKGEMIFKKIIYELKVRGWWIKRRGLDGRKYPAN